MVWVWLECSTTSYCDWRLGLALAQLMVLGGVRTSGRWVLLDDSFRWFGYKVYMCHSLSFCRGSWYSGKHGPVNLALFAPVGYLIDCCCHSYNSVSPQYDFTKQPNKWDMWSDLDLPWAKHTLSHYKVR